MRRLFESLPGGVPTIHFGTGTAGLLPFMADAGGEVIGVDWRIDIDRAKAAVGGRPVQGNLDPMIAAGPWKAAAVEAESILEAVAGKPGHVFNLGHGVLPQTPVENLQRLVELVHRWRPSEPMGAAR
jgi:uroporphyrinogen decarboxylase